MLGDEILYNVKLLVTCNRYKSALNRSPWSASDDKNQQSGEKSSANIDLYFMNYLIICSVALEISLIFRYKLPLFRIYRLLRFIWHCDFLYCFSVYAICLCCFYIFLVRFARCFCVLRSILLVMTTLWEYCLNKMLGLLLLFFSPKRNNEKTMWIKQKKANRVTTNREYP